MRHIILFLGVMLFSFSLAAQYRDSKMMIGEGYSMDYHLLIDFNNNPITATRDSTSIDFACRNCPTICNEQGELQFYSNGRLVMDKNGDLMMNGDSFPLGPYEPPEMGSSYYKYGFILPDFNDTNIYYYFYVDYYHEMDGSGTATDAFRSSLYYLKVDMSMNNGLGVVVEKNIPVLLRDTMVGFTCFTPVRHANGRDWWFITNEAEKNIYHRVLWTPDGFKTDFLPFSVPGFIEDLGNTEGIVEGISVDGTKFSAVGGHSIWVYDFDRCTGLLYNPVRLKLDTVNYYWMHDVAFSYNNRYVFTTDYNFTDHVSSFNRYDLWSPDPAASKLTIHAVTSSSPADVDLNRVVYLFSFPTGQLALVNTPFSSVKSLRFLPYSDSTEIIIDTTMIKWDFYTSLYQVRNEVPSYYLGPIDGSSCDTLGLNNNPLAHWRYDRRPNPLEIKFVDLTYYLPTYWSWDFGDGQSSTEQHPLHLFDEPGTYEVCLIVGNQYSADTLCKMVTVGDFLSVDIVADTLAGCAPLQIAYHAETVDANSVHWTFAGGIPAQSDATDVTVTYDTAGTFTTSLTGTGFLGDKTASQVVTVYPKPIADYQFTVTDLEISTNNTSQGATHYLWDFGDGSTDTTDNPTHVFGGSGSYNILLIASNDCGSDTLSRNLIITGINDVDAGFAFSLYPNPNDGIFEMELFSDRADLVDLTIFDILGRPIWQKSWTKRKSLKTNVNLNEKGILPKGNYLFRLRFGDRLTWGKVLVE